MWPHTSTEEDMEKICGLVNLGDYMAPLGSGLNNASNPTVPGHCNLGLLSLEKKVNLHPISPSLVSDTRDGAVNVHVCLPA